jgi:hypothetical protein
MSIKTNKINIEFYSKQIYENIKHNSEQHYRMEHIKIKNILNAYLKIIESTHNGKYVLTDEYVEYLSSRFNVFENTIKDIFLCVSNILNNI